VTSVTPLFFSSLRNIKGIKTNSGIAHEKIYIYIYIFKLWIHGSRRFKIYLFVICVYLCTLISNTSTEDKRLSCRSIYIYIVNFTSPLILILSDCKALFNTAYVYSALPLRAAVIECTSEFKQHTEFKL
jgi:hypothetical protein